jgi:hypothetical protein
MSFTPSSISEVANSKKIFAIYEYLTDDKSQILGSKLIGVIANPSGRLHTTDDAVVAWASIRRKAKDIAGIWKDIVPEEGDDKRCTTRTATFHLVPGYNRYHGIEIADYKDAPEYLDCRGFPARTFTAMLASTLKVGPFSLEALL